MQTKWKIITALLVCLAVTIPAVLADTAVSGGPSALATGTGSSGGGSYNRPYTSGSIKGVEVGVSAWAIAAAGGTGSASTTYTGSPTLTDTKDSTTTSTAYTDSFTATVKNAQVTASVDKTTTGGTSSAGASVYAFAQANPDQATDDATPVIKGEAAIKAGVGPVAIGGILGPNDPNAPTATAFTGAGTASASASGEALFDVSHNFKGTSTEVLKIYGQVGSDSKSATADMYGSRTATTAGSSGDVAQAGTSSIVAASSANYDFAKATVTHTTDLTATGESATDLTTKINGTSNTATAVSGAWDNKVDSATTKTKGSNEVSYASATGNVSNAVGSYKASDVGKAIAIMMADANENHKTTYTAKSTVDYKTFSSATRGTSSSSTNLVYGSANIGSGITNAKVMTSATTSSQVQADTGVYQKGFYGMNSGSQLRYGVSGATGNVYAGERFLASSDLGVSATGYVPVISTQFGTVNSAYGWDDNNQGAKTGTSADGKWSSSDSSGGWAMIGNFLAQATVPAITGSPFKTSWNNLYFIGWAEGSDPSVHISAWNNGIAFVGTDANSRPSGKIGTDKTTTDQTNRQYDRYIETSNKQ